MSILIKGMEMPKDGAKLYMIAFSDGKACASYKPFEWHEVVSLPPHGRLIDADALADVFRGFIAMYDSCPFSQLSLPDKARRDELQSSLAEVINAPTIIPASGGKEDE